VSECAVVGCELPATYQLTSGAPVEPALVCRGHAADAAATLVGAVVVPVARCSRAGDGWVCSVGSTPSVVERS